MAIAVVHLVWAPLGPHPLKSFLASYRRHRAGADHELVVLLNGLPAPGVDREETRAALLAELAGVEHRLIELERPLLDLAAYDVVARAVDHERVCILNSHSLLLAEDWLAQLHDASRGAPGGLVGASGSWESQADWRRNRPLYQAVDLLRLRGLRRDFAPFPNPHLRTNAFMGERRLLADLGLARARDKRSSYVLESGRAGISRQVVDRGGQLVVVGRDGEQHPPGGWAASATFRSGGQEQLLVSDNQTRAYDLAPESERRRLRRAAWGSPEEAAGSE
jgi:hypothetical protein